MHARAIKTWAPEVGESEARRSGSEEHTSELQSPCNLVCRLLLEKKKKIVDLIEPRSRHHLLPLRLFHNRHHNITRRPRTFAGRTAHPTQPHTLQFHPRHLREPTT